MRYKVTRHPLVRDDLSTMTIFIGEYAGYDIAEKKMGRYRSFAVFTARLSACRHGPG